MLEHAELSFGCQSGARRAAVMRGCDSCCAAAEKAQRIASRLAAAKEEPTVNVHSTVNQLQSYLMDNSHIRVFFLDDQSGEDSVRHPFALCSPCGAALRHAHDPPPLPLWACQSAS